MSVFDVTIISAALINLIFAGTVYLHSSRKLVVTVFAVFALSVSLWALATFLMTSGAVSFDAFKAGAILHYLSGNLVFWCLLWFSVFYPERKNHSLFLPAALSGINAGILILIVATRFLFTSIQDAALIADKITFDTSGYLILSIVTVSMFLVSQIFLARKYLRETGEEKTKIGGIILATAVAGLLGLFTNLILPGFGVFSYFYFGPIITTPLFVGIMIYAIVRYKVFNLRVIAAEIFTGFLMIALLAELFLSSTSAEFGTRSVILFIAAVIGFFLIKSVYREIKAREEIERLNQAMSEFVAITSHQIRTPLTHIKDALSLVKEGDYGTIGPRAVPVINRVFLSTGQLIGLVNDLLDMSRMESGRMQYAFAEFDFSELVDSIVGEFRIPAADKGITIVWQKEDKPISVWGDRDKLRQVIFNLVDNALKYTEKGVIELKAESGFGVVEFTSKDSGIGMTNETIDKLFEKFSRGESGQKKKAPGTGLGLYVAKRIVDDHKGELWAASEGEGKGSVFHLLLRRPVSKAGTAALPITDDHLPKAA